jgi:hypothetical protein
MHPFDARACLSEPFLPLYHSFIPKTFSEMDTDALVARWLEKDKVLLSSGPSSLPFSCSQAACLIHPIFVRHRFDHDLHRMKRPDRRS